MTKEQVIKIGKYIAGETKWRIDRGLSYIALGPGTGLYFAKLREEEEPKLTERRAKLDQQRKEITKQFRR